MTDAAIVWNTATGRGDLQITGADLLTGNDLDTAIIISLFTDRLAHPDDVIPDGTDDPRGWWGDLDQDYQIGSRLWLLERAPASQQTLLRAQDYAAEALQWMIDDGVVAKFDIYAEWTRPGMLGMKITVYQTNGTVVAKQYDWAWKGLN
ncbi:MAG: phage GP46 family protein [Alphaproteobacteria bacterium]|nr:phage GP46 family protein [Alphaproteobacteria bacterium]